MAILVNPNNVKVISQNGEVTLALQIDLNINLNCGGVVSQGTSSVNNSGPAPIKKDDDEAAWLVPDFNSKEKIKFGK
jgi:hypothetical protein